MIVTREVNIFISNKIIGYYRNLGYNIIPNSHNIISVEDLLKYSTIKVDVRCDLCGVENNISFQKYNKNTENYGIYTCSKCSKFKTKLTLEKIYGDVNFNRSEENKIKTKEKYDKITKEIEACGYIICNRCESKNDLSNYLKNVNGRYKRICKKCRTEQNSNNRRKRDMSPYYKLNYRRNVHVFAWRNLLKNYLARKSLRKLERTIELLKYTPEELRLNLENKFTEDMNWSNYGKNWQIDHIVPISLFKDDTPCHIVNGLDNLRPLNKSVNMSKGNKMDDRCIDVIEQYFEYIKDEFKKLLDR